MKTNKLPDPFLKKFFKYFSTIAIFSALLLTLFWVTDFAIRIVNPPPAVLYGATFSSAYSQELGLNPPQVLTEIMEELKVKNLRIPVYWDNIEPTKDNFNFQDVDTLLDIAQQKQARVILALGYKVPRWPECFPPSWAKNLDKSQYQKQILKLLSASVEHFKNRPEIVAWQVENEPLLAFGNCQMFDKSFLEEEVNLVRSKDSRPIILTDSGELGLWVTALQFSDIMGTSLYRTVWNPLFGFFRYPFPPLYYRLKVALTKQFFAAHSQGILISELQAEPWSPGKSLPQIPISDQIKIFSLEDFQEIIDFTSHTHIKEQYLWGIEWWYWMKLHGHPEYWNYAKGLF